MKKMFKKILLTVLSLALLLSVFSCLKDNTDIKYNEGGLNYSLPDYMKKMEVPAAYGDVAYGSLDERNIEFLIYFYPKESLMSQLLLDMNATVKEYADDFVLYHGYEKVEESYSEQECLITLKYVYEGDFYFDYIVRNEYTLYHVTMTCKAKDRETYEPTFVEWTKKISMDY